ncbi:hypothetical protein CEQ90_05190 [Lewinellaceae bacterium SD302]|nr:hypothetical protein CEQ90_05190 [Lewinellaceae bacterium SD302]
MKYLKSIMLLSGLIIGLALLPHKAHCQKVKISIESIREKCSDLPIDDRVRVTVAGFSTQNLRSRGHYGGELSTMLTSALQQVNCFEVLESLNNMDDLMGEIEFGQQGSTVDGSSPEAGMMQGAQAVLTGSITEFRTGKVGLTGQQKCDIGFIIKVVNPQTRSVLWTRSIEATGKEGIFSNYTGNQGTAPNDAMERGIIKAVYELVEDMDKINFPAPSEPAEAKVFNAENCPVLGSAKPVKVMVLTAEKYVSRYAPKPTGETSIIDGFLRAGFKVVDPAMYATLRNGARFKDALADPLAAVSLGREFGADVVVFGEGVGQSTGRTAGGVSCRATLDLRAIQVSDASILAVAPATSGATDVAETAAYQSAFRKAGAQATTKLLEGICSNVNVGSIGSNAGGTMTTINVNNTDYLSLKKVKDLFSNHPKVSSVDQPDFSNGRGVIVVMHKMDQEAILDILLDKGSALAEITGTSSNSIDVNVKR